MKLCLHSKHLHTPLPALAAVAVLALAGCPHPPEAPPEIPVARAATPHVANGEPTEEASEPTATLVVSADIVNACPTLVRLREGSVLVSPEDRWLAILDVLANCMTDGQLRGRTIVLRGVRPACELVTSVLEARGVGASRVASDPKDGRREARLDIALAEQARSI